MRLKVYGRGWENYDLFSTFYFQLLFATDFYFLLLFITFYGFILFATFCNFLLHLLRLLHFCFFFYYFYTGFPAQLLAWHHREAVGSGLLLHRDGEGAGLRRAMCSGTTFMHKKVSWKMLGCRLSRFCFVISNYYFFYWFINIMPLGRNRNYSMDSY